MRLIPDWVIYALVLGIFLYNAMAAKRDVVAPAPPPELGPVLPSQSPRDQRIIIRLDQPKSGVGTAFSIDRKGTWMTARHVVDSCQEVGVKIGPTRILRTQPQIIENADIAILSSGWQRTPLPSDVNTNRRIGEVGYFFGFPQGRSGEVVGSLIGRSRMLIRGRYRTDEGVLAWSELGRSRGLLGSLGGLSGAPVLDQDGEVIGVVSAENPRRGRIYSVAPKNLRAHLPASQSRAEPLSLDKFGLQADRLRRDRRIAQVICLVR